MPARRAVPAARRAACPCAEGAQTQRDPVLDGLNWYSYVNGGVMTAADPSGRAAIIRIRRRSLGSGSAVKDWLWDKFWPYDHAYLYFDTEPCVVKCIGKQPLSGVGLYSGILADTGTWDFIGDDSDKHGKGSGTIMWADEIRLGDKAFNRALCQCINDWYSLPWWSKWPRYFIGSACGFWARRMWECAVFRVDGIVAYQSRNPMPYLPLPFPKSR